MNKFDQVPSAEVPGKKESVALLREAFNDNQKEDTHQNVARPDQTTNVSVPENEQIAEKVAQLEAVYQASTPQEAMIRPEKSYPFSALYFTKKEERILKEEYGLGASITMSDLEGALKEIETTLHARKDFPIWQRASTVGTGIALLGLEEKLQEVLTVHRRL